MQLHQHEQSAPHRREVRAQSVSRTAGQRSNRWSRPVGPAETGLHSYSSKTVSTNEAKAFKTWETPTTAVRDLQPNTKVPPTHLFTQSGAGLTCQPYHSTQISDNDDFPSFSLAASSDTQTKAVFLAQKTCFSNFRAHDPIWPL